jgi:hypothetical protein
MTVLMVVVYLAQDSLVKGCCDYCNEPALTAKNFLNPHFFYFFKKYTY